MSVGVHVKVAGMEGNGSSADSEYRASGGWPREHA